MEYVVTTFYKFMPLEEAYLNDIKDTLLSMAQDHQVFGLLLLSPEGVNATVVAPRSTVDEVKNFLTTQFGELPFKDSPAEKNPFKRFKVSIRKEIVQLKRPDIQPTGNEVHLSPAEWDEMLESEDVLLVDVRNWYETMLGSFKNAIDPKTMKFSNFPAWVKKSQLPKNKKIGIFCTGGIRCEKAAVAMKELGYENVVQLDGGILNYIEQRPGKNYEGECFVFDHRVAVRQDLRPSEKYSVCPHCGNAGDTKKTCVACSHDFVGCADCISTLNEMVCSKRCKNEFARAR